MTFEKIVSNPNSEVVTTRHDPFLECFSILEGNGEQIFFKDFYPILASSCYDCPYIWMRSLMQICKICKICKICTWALHEERASQELFRHRQSRAGLRRRVADDRLCSAVGASARRSWSSPVIAPSAPRSAASALALAYFANQYAKYAKQYAK
jgi:hypothetical protein